MTIKQLYIFKVVCEEGSVTKAANRLYLTQPAVSHVINELEVNMGVLLFDRLSKKIFLNETGKLFLEKAVRILDLYDDLEKGGCPLEKHAVLRIGSSITIANYWLPAILKRFEAVCGDTPITVDVNSAKIITDKLLNNEFDIAFIEGPIAPKQLTAIPFSSYQLLAVCSPSHPISSSAEISVTDLAAEKLLLREKGSAVRDVLDSVFLLHGISIEPTYTSVNSGALLQAARHNLGITILPDILIQQEVANGEVTAIPIKNITLANRNHLVFHKDKFKTEPIKILIDSVLMI